MNSKHLKSLSLISIFLLLFSCQSNDNTSTNIEIKPPTIIKETINKIIPEPKVYEEFDRTKSKQRIADKIANDQPLVVHVMVPLCDNDHQGIVPVNKTLGDGFNPRTNLYWGALYGIKTHFKKQANWQLVSAEQNLSEAVLERVIFYQEFPNKAKVYVVADAYRGDKMEACLIDFFEGTSGASAKTIEAKSTKLGVYSNADLLVMNGHNGLMDVDVKHYESIDNKVRDVGLICCITASYFREHLLHSKAYPVLSTNNLMAPEAYVLNGLIGSWANQKTEKEIHSSVAQAYHQYQKCGINGAGRLFRVGW